MLLMAIAGRDVYSKVSTVFQAALYSLAALAFGSTVALPALLLAGIPLYSVLRKRGYVTLPVALVGGAVVGGLSGLLIVAFGITSPGWPTIWFTAYYGAWVGAGFWLGLGRSHRTLWQTATARAA
jgi:hypothetical protein